MRLGLAFLFLPALAHAQTTFSKWPEEEPPPPPPPAPAPDPDDNRRILGAGSGIGGGYVAGTLHASDGTTRQLETGSFLFPTLEATVFIDRNELFSIDATVPLTSLGITWVLIGGFAWSMDTFFCVNPGSDHVRFVGGAGVGFTAFTGSLGTGSSFRIPAQLGVEFLVSSGRGIGLKLLARPWIEFGTTRSSSTDSFFRLEGGDSTSGGIVGVLDVTFYYVVTRASRSSTIVSAMR